MFNPQIILSVLVLLMVAGVVSMFAKKISKIPYTVLLVLVGFLIAIISKVPGLSFITAFELTPEVLFYIFLPALIFEAAYNVHIQKFYKSFFSISLLSTVGLIASTLIIGFGTYFVLSLFGIHVPILLLLLFGSVISATDPVAVLALFKSLGAPKKLSLIFEGESLFNDATAVALFLALLAIIQNPLGVTSLGVSHGILLFVSMIVLGIFAGYLIGKFFSWLINISKHNEMAVLSFMLVMAHLTFLLSELANVYWHAQGIAIGISPIIATTIASMELGNNGGLSIAPRVKKFIHGFWEQTTFFANSIVFLLVGILVVKQDIFSTEILVPIVVGILFVFISRVLAVYPLLSIIGRLGLEEKLPRSWRLLMSWASIRGALSIIVILTVPENLTVPGWEFAMSPRDFLVGLTLGAVMASLVGKTLTVPSLLKKLKILNLTVAENIMLSETRRFVNVLKLKKLESSHHKGYIAKHSYDVLSDQLSESISSCPLGDSHVFENVIEHYALGIEKYHLEQLYSRNEIPTNIFRRIHTKIDGQEIAADRDKACEGLFVDRFVEQRIVHHETRNDNTLANLSIKDQYLYHRALSVMARKVVKNVKGKDFPECYDKQIRTIIDQYQKYKDKNQVRMDYLESQHPEIIHPVLREMAENMLSDYQESVLDELVASKFTTNRVRSHMK